ncbi:HAD family hydrolase [Helicobacter ailurogastricus]|uniref:HAD family hydrolase n=1 Tax=Helicobacter ailurogastricus TaxID=1578720 RepID=UPI000CF082FD|nr:HAD family hydrolase [Helicobacter ailurogastricus]
MALKIVVWDFDGVVFDSMHLKGEGFKVLFQRHTKADERALKAFEDYHYANGGVSRFDKIAHFYTKILKKSIEADTINALVEEFGQIIAKDLFSREHLNAEVLDFIKANHKKYIFHIASAALYSELQVLCEFLGLLPYFKSIEGAPPAKAKILANMCANYGYAPSEMVLIGDSRSDHESAQANKIPFLGYNNPVLQNLLPKAYINHFARLDLDALTRQACLDQF